MGLPTSIASVLRSTCLPQCRARRRARSCVRTATSEFRDLYRVWRSGYSCRFLSTGNATDATTTPEEAAEELERVRPASVVQQPHPPRPLFPWRHEPDLLPRLTPGTPEFARELYVSPRGQTFLASIFLQLSWLEAFFGTAWRQELADAAAWAFARSVAAVCSQTYQVPYDTVAYDDKVFLHWPRSSSTETPTKANAANAADGVDSPTQERPMGAAAAREPDLTDMMGPELRELYRSAAAAGKDQMRIKLHMEPTNAHVYQLFCLPFMSKEEAQRNPKMVQEMHTRVRRLRTAPRQTMQSFSAYIEEQFQQHDYLETTLDLQVVVECEEIFSVHDAVTGQCWQGHHDGNRRPVVHLVRLETSVITRDGTGPPYLPTHELQGWKVTNIDDLVGSKAWYQLDSYAGDDDDNEG